MQMNKEIFAQTDRLVLRKFNRNDYLNLCGSIAGRKKQCTPTRALFRTAKCRHGSIISCYRYREEGVGLYAVELKDGGRCARLHGAHSVYLHRVRFSPRGEIAFIMQLGALLEELTVARQQPRSRQR